MDTVIALFAGVVIFSLVFAYGTEPDAGPGLIFETLPVLFAQTGPWVSVPFFLLLTFAALTSTISGLEVVTSYFIDRHGWKRMKATVMIGAAIWAVGLICAVDSLKVPFRGTDQSFFDIFDFVTTNYMLPVGGLLTCIFVAWVVKDRVRAEEFGSSGPIYKTTVFLLKYLTPIAVLVVLLHGLELLPFVDY
jgi:NSS family neurotransmitter:Na+ symporter